MKKKNEEYQAKLTSWAAREPERKKAKKKTVQYEKELWEFFNKEMPFKKDLSFVNRCRDDLHRLIENMKTRRVENKMINNFLKDMSLNKRDWVQVDDLDKALKARQVTVTERMHLIDKFVDSVKKEHTIEGKYTNFFRLPDHVVTLGLTRTQYEGTVLKLMVKAKDVWLEEKKKKVLKDLWVNMVKEQIANGDEDKKFDEVKFKKENKELLEQVTVTDHDLTPLEIFDTIASQMKNKMSE